MTICIAAICKLNGEGVFVLATDRMVSVGYLGQFEHGIKKYKEINHNTMAMLAGDALIFKELIDTTQQMSDYNIIKDKIHANFLQIVKDTVQKVYLEQFGFEFADIKDLVKEQSQNPFIANILHKIVKFDLNTSVLLVGFHEDTLMMINEINQRGIADLSDIHFHAIGSGALQAENTLLFQSQSKDTDLKTTIYNVFKAKRNAEAASGVGKYTDMLIFSQSGITELEEPDLKLLARVYEKEVSSGKGSKLLNQLTIADMDTGA